MKLDSLMEPDGTTLLYHALDSRYYDPEDGGAYARNFDNRREYRPYFYSGA